MKRGALVYDELNDRYDIRFGFSDYYGGLHCGTTLEVRLNKKWIPTRIEKSSNWYLVGIKTFNLVGLQVRLN